MTWHLDGAPAPVANGYLLVGDMQYPLSWPREALEALGLTWIEPEQPASIPMRVTKSDFRRLLTGGEAAAWQRLKKETQALAPADYEAAFDPDAPRPDLQVLIAVEDVIEQFGLPAEFIELDHPDTAQGLQVLAMAGMFGADAATRVPRILSGLSPI